MTAAELKTTLRAVGLTQGRFARALGVAPETVSRWSLGHLEVPRYAELALTLIAQLQHARIMPDLGEFSL